MKLLVSGHTGLIGRKIVSACVKLGIEVVGLSRRPAPDDRAVMNWDEDEVMARKIGRESPDAVIHLAGESIAGGFWTAKRKGRLYSSRVVTTGKLVRVINLLSRPPSVFLCASAVGIYGNQPTRQCDESCPVGPGFLANICGDWEEACGCLDERVRSISLRFGMILSRDGGALAQMLRIFRLGLGGRLGRGNQMISWIHPDDAVGSIMHLLDHGKISGPVNIVSPNPVSNREFTRMLAREVKRPAFFDVPDSLLRCLPGGMADELLLSGCQAVPRKLLESGYPFKYPGLEVCLKNIIHPLSR